jgi:hypothetical protein
MPVTDLSESPAGLYSSPDSYFQTLDAVEQDRVFTKAGAAAIRAGADPVEVVTARTEAKGIDYNRRVVSPGTLTGSGRRLQRSIIGYRDGQPVFGYTTGYGTTRRGAIAKNARTAGLTAGKRVRLMPETIIGLTDDPELRRILLRDAGYFRYPTAGSTTGWVAKRNALIRDDRAAADEFYRGLGISL